MPALPQFGRGCRGAVAMTVPHRQPPVRPLPGRRGSTARERGGAGADGRRDLDAAQRQQRPWHLGQHRVLELLRRRWRHALPHRPGRRSRPVARQGRPALLHLGAVGRELLPSRPRRRQPADLADRRGQALPLERHFRQGGGILIGPWAREKNRRPAWNFSRNDRICHRVAAETGRRTPLWIGAGVLLY